MRGCWPGRSSRRSACWRSATRRCGRRRVPHRGLLEPWHRWDAPHYTDIAVFGYMANDPGNLTRAGLPAGLPRRPRPVTSSSSRSSRGSSGSQRRCPRPDRLRLRRRDGGVAVRGAGAVSAGEGGPRPPHRPLVGRLPARLPDRLFPAHRLHREPLPGARLRLAVAGTDEPMVVGRAPRRSSPR